MSIEVSGEMVRHQERKTHPVRRVATAPARGLKALAGMVFGSGGGIIWRFLPRTRFDYAREVGDGMGSSLIMAPILWMARTFPEAPLQVIDADEQEIPAHPLVRLIRRPNPFYSGSVLWMATLISWVLDGNAYWIKERNQTGTGIVRLWWVPHWMIEPISESPTEFISKYRYRPGGETIDLEIDEVVHLRYGLDPRNPRKGLSPLGTVFREVFTDDEAANFAASLLRNVGVPGIVVSPEPGAPSPGEDDVQATKDYVRESFAGDRRGEPLVMSGATKVQQFGFSPEQMTLTAVRRIPEERVSAVLGLPAIVAGFGAGLDRSTFANYAEAREAAYESNIIPTQRLMAEELRHQLLPDFEDRPELFDIAFDLRKVRVLQEDRNQEAERIARLYTAGLITRKEGRDGTGHESGPADDVYAVPLAVILTPASESPGDRLDALEAAKGLKARAKHTALQANLLKALDRDAQRLVPVLAQQLELDLDTLGRDAAGHYEQLTAKSNGNGHQKATQTDQTLVEEILAALEIAEWKDSTLRVALEAHYARTTAMTLATLNSVLELGVMLPDPVERKIVQDGGVRQGLIDIDSETRQALYQALADAREAGEGPLQAARRIRSYVPAGRFVNAGAKYRAELIARTETKYAQNVSSLAAYQQSGTVTAVVALDALGEHSDPECEARDGTTMTFDQAQIETDAEHPQGTLSFAPVVGAAAQEG